jgi:uncharacterized protein (TIGR00369 family)
MSGSARSRASSRAGGEPISAVDLDDVRSFFSEHLPFFDEFGFSIDSIDYGEAVARFTYDDRWTRPYEIINGGTLMALADVAVYMAIFGRAGIVPLAVTNELKMNFLRPAVGGDVLARAQLMKVGRRVAYATVDVFMDGEPERVVAHATASYILPEE